MASAYCLPIVVKYEQNSLAIRVLSVDFTPFTINVSEMVLLLLTRVDVLVVIRRYPDVFSNTSFARRTGQYTKASQL